MAKIETTYLSKFVNSMLDSDITQNIDIAKSK